MHGIIILEFIYSNFRIIFFELFDHTRMINTEKNRYQILVIYKYF